MRCEPMCDLAKRLIMDSAMLARGFYVNTFNIPLLQ
jgi:hypothetical protein